MKKGRERVRFSVHREKRLSIKPTARGGGREKEFSDDGERGEGETLLVGYRIC